MPFMTHVQHINFVVSSKPKNDGVCTTGFMIVLVINLLYRKLFCPSSANNAWRKSAVRMMTTSILITINNVHEEIFGLVVLKAEIMASKCNSGFASENWIVFFKVFTTHSKHFSRAKYLHILMKFHVCYRHHHQLAYSHIFSFKT